MSVKLKISYEHPEDEQTIRAVMRRLSPLVKCCKFPKGQQGQHKKAYVILRGENEVEA